MYYCANREDIYLRVLKSYYQSTERYREELPKFYQEDDMEQYTIAVHALKSTSLNIGAESLSELARRHEIAAKVNDKGTIEESFEQLMTLLEAVLEEVQSMLAE